MSEEQEMLDYEAHNAKVALDLNKAQQRIAKLEAALDKITFKYSQVKGDSDDE
jgi:hypothetical protein